MKEVIVDAEDLVCLNKEKLQEIIRCKDCKYRDEQTANCARFRKGWYVQSNSFCSWAERKEE